MSNRSAFLGSTPNRRRQPSRHRATRGVLGLERLESRTLLSGGPWRPVDTELHPVGSGHAADRHEAVVHTTNEDRFGRGAADDLRDAERPNLGNGEIDRPAQPRHASLRPDFRPAFPPPSHVWDSEPEGEAPPAIQVPPLDTPISTPSAPVEPSFATPPTRPEITLPAPMPAQNLAAPNLAAPNLAAPNLAAPNLAAPNLAAQNLAAPNVSVSNTAPLSSTAASSTGGSDPVLSTVASSVGGTASLAAPPGAEGETGLGGARRSEQETVPLTFGMGASSSTGTWESDRRLAANSQASVVWPTSSGLEFNSATPSSDIASNISSDDSTPASEVREASEPEFEDTELLGRTAERTATRDRNRAAHGEGTRQADAGRFRESQETARAMGERELARFLGESIEWAEPRVSERNVDELPSETDSEGGAIELALHVASTDVVWTEAGGSAHSYSARAAFFGTTAEAEVGLSKLSTVVVAGLEAPGPTAASTSRRSAEATVTLEQASPHRFSGNTAGHGQAGHLPAVAAAVGPMTWLAACLVPGGIVVGLSHGETGRKLRDWLRLRFHSGRFHSGRWMTRRTALHD